MRIKDEWKLFGEIIFSPFLLITLLLTLIGLCSPLYINDEYRTVINTLQVVASIFSGIAGSLIADRYKEFTGNTILWKKGASAVRNLALIRHKTKNIIRRIKNQSSLNESVNLVELLEKDIANATREWSDIIPGITDVLDENYTILEEKEKVLDNFLKDKEQWSAELERQGQQRDLQIQNKLADNEKNINELTKQIAKLQSTVESPRIGTPFIVSGGYDIDVPAYKEFTVGGLDKKCKTCGKSYTPTLLDGGQCGDCTQNNLLGKFRVK